MAYNEKLANMTRELIAQTHKNVEEKAMFGGLCFMVNDKMCVGVNKGRLMVRFDPAKNEEVMEKEGARPTEFTGRTMKGFAFVDENVLTTKKKLEYWIKLALDFNKHARSSKKSAANKPTKKKK
jgi:TfoX/Sxy family transcriptional regulator of competence genes